MNYRVYHAPSFEYLGLVDEYLETDDLTLTRVLRQKGIGRVLKFLPFPRTKGSISKTLDEMRYKATRSPQKATPRDDLPE